MNLLRYVDNCYENIEIKHFDKPTGKTTLWKWSWQTLKVTSEGEISQETPKKWSSLVNYHTDRDHTWYQAAVQYLISKDIFFLEFDVSSRSHIKVKGHRRGYV